MEEIIKAYLEQRALTDESVARNLQKENKSIKGCCEYITKMARKQIKGNAGMIEDDVVYGWAVHYYDEDSLPEDKKPTPKAKVVTPEPLPTREPPKPKYIQFDLFAELDKAEEKPVVVTPLTKEEIKTQEQSISDWERYQLQSEIDETSADCNIGF